MKSLKFAMILMVGTSISCLAAPPRSAPLPLACRQVVMVIAPSWSSSKGELEGFRRLENGTWRREFGPVPVLLGKRGLAWGIGIAGQGEEGVRKQEKDWRSPAGVFRIGKIYTYDRTLPSGIDYPFVTMTARDVWVSNPKSPDYNRHLQIDLKNPPSWYRRERMRLGDPAHRYMLEICHNTDSPVPGAGSAIFFHIRRGPNVTTSGCTVLAQKDLLGLLRWLRAQDFPCYVLLPWQVYKMKWDTWRLPVQF